MHARPRRRPRRPPRPSPPPPPACLTCPPPRAPPALPTPPRRSRAHSASPPQSRTWSTVAGRASFPTSLPASAPRRCRIRRRTGPRLVRISALSSTLHRSARIPMFARGSPLLLAVCHEYGGGPRAPSPCSLSCTAKRMRRRRLTFRGRCALGDRNVGCHLGHVRNTRKLAREMLVSMSRHLRPSAFLSSLASS